MFAFRSFPLRPLARRGAWLVALALAAGSGTLPAARAHAAEADTVLARVGDRNVTLAEFRRSWNRLLLAERPAGSTPRDQYRTFLDDIVVRQLLANEASRHPKKLLPVHEAELEKLRLTMLRNRLFEIEVLDSIDLDAVNYATLREQMQWALDLRAFVFEDQGAAQAWYTRLISGTPISRLETLAINQEPGAPRLMDLGRRVREQLSDSVATVVYTLPAGRFSRPLPEAGIFAIYHVTHRWQRPAPFDLDNAAALRGHARTLLGNDARERYRRQLGVEMGIRYENAAIDTLLNRFLLVPPRVEGAESGGGEVRAMIPLPVLQKSDSNLVLAHTRQGRVTGRELIRFLEATPPYARPEVRTRPQLIPWIDRVAFDQELLRRALARGLDRDPEVLRELERRVEGYQVELLYADSVEAHVTFPEDSLRALYAADSTRFDVQEVAKVWAMITEQESEARHYLEAVKAGADADSIARRYSIHPESAARGGVSDWFRRGMTPNAAVEEAVFATAVGDFGGPIRSPDGWVIYRVLNKAGRVDRGYDEVQADLRREYQPREEERLMTRFLDRLRARYPVTLFPENIRYLEQQLS